MEMSRLLILFLTLVPPTSVQQPTPDMVPGGRAFVFEPATSGGSTRFVQVTVPGPSAPAGPLAIEAWVKHRDGTTVYI